MGGSINERFLRMACCAYETPIALNPSFQIDPTKNGAANNFATPFFHKLLYHDLMKLLTDPNPTIGVWREVIAHWFGIVFMGYLALRYAPFGLGLLWVVPLVSCIWVYSGMRWIGVGAVAGGRLLVAMGFLAAGMTTYAIGTWSR